LPVDLIFKILSVSAVKTIFIFGFKKPTVKINNNYK
jgi:hypothetical protein